jgi:hypothetical protein
MGKNSDKQLVIARSPDEIGMTKQSQLDCHSSAGFSQKVQPEGWNPVENDRAKGLQ